MNNIYFGCLSEYFFLKKIKIAFLILLSFMYATNFAQAQSPFQLFEQTPYSDWFGDAVIMPNGNLLYTYEQSTPINSYHICIRTPQGETITKYTFTDLGENPSPNELSTSFKFVKITADIAHQQYFVLAKVTTLAETDGLLITLDQDGNFVEEVRLEVPRYNSNISFLFVNKDNDITIAGFVPTNPGVESGSFIGVYTKAGEIINYAEYPESYCGGLVQFDTGEYLLHTPWNIRSLNENLEELYSIPLSISSHSPPALKPYDNIEQNQFYFIGGHKYGTSSPSHTIPSIYRVNHSGEYSLIYEDNNPDNHNLYMQTRKAFDYVDSTHLYIASLRTCNYITCPKEIYLYSINSNGTLNWLKKIPSVGFDINRVIATSDLGCLLFVSSAGINKDIYLVKFDKFGNVEPNWLTANVLNIGEGSNLPLLTVALSPNPATDIVQFSYPAFADAAALSFTLYDAVGRQVLHQPQIGTQADISRLPQGIYYYQINQQGKPLQSGKLARQ